jgi:hypothetical protein
MAPHCPSKSDTHSSGYFRSRRLSGRPGCWRQGGCGRGGFSVIVPPSPRSSNTNTQSQYQAECFWKHFFGRQMRSAGKPTCRLQMRIFSAEKPRRFKSVGWEGQQGISGDTNPPTGTVSSATSDEVLGHQHL